MLLKDKERLETPLAVLINTTHDGEDQADILLGEQNQEGSENQTTVYLSAASSAVPWEERYEKIWVENEKREVKSYYKDVAAELKKRFGEICLKQSSEKSSISMHLRVDLNNEDDSSDEDEIVYQMAKTQSGILQPIPEQKESSLEDSITEPSKPELKGSKIPDKAVNSNKQDEHPLKEDDNEILPPVQKRENDIAGYDTDLDSDPEQSAEEKPKCSIDGSGSSVENNTNPDHSKNSKEEDDDNKYQDFVNAGQKNTPLSEDDFELIPTSQPVCAPASKYPSDEELEGDMQRFKNEVGMLKVVFLALEKEKAQLQKEAALRQLQQELADALKKLSMSEASLEVNTRYRNDLEAEKIRFQKDIDRLKGKLQETEDQFIQSERRIHELKNALDDKEREVIASSQKLQESLSASSGMEKTVKQLDEHIQRLEIENARLEATAKQQTNRIEVLQKEVHGSASVQNRLEDLVTNLQGAKINLEEQLNQEMETEKKKTKKIAELKRSTEARLDQEMKRNSELQKEINRMRALVKTAKKKQKQQETGEFASQLSSIRGELDNRHLETGTTIARLKSKTQAASQEALEQIKATNEATLRNQLEQRIRDLEGELSRARSTQQNSLSQRDSTQTELERYKELYSQEFKLRKSLAAKLDRSNERLAEANTKLLNERPRNKSFIASSIVNGSLTASPVLDVNQLQGSIGNFGGTLGPLHRNLGLGGSFLNPVGDGTSPNSRVDAYIAKMQNELEKNITKELDHDC
ncbi:UNVERIFIED_CONTAM: hypothetical protein FKN15_042109 [Acipenser sinensis]